MHNTSPINYLLELEQLDLQTTRQNTTPDNIKSVYDNWRNTQENSSIDSFYNALKTGDVPGNYRLLIQYKDRLTDIENRQCEGEYFTPSHIVERAHEYMKRAFPDELCSPLWWDMACGTGNLLIPCLKQEHGEILATTINSIDIPLIHDALPSQHVKAVQYDFLSCAASNEIDQAVAGADKIVILVNPPYATTANIRKGEHKDTIVNTPVCQRMIDDDLGRASYNLTTQFLYRIIELSKQKEVIVGLFSQVNFISSPGYKKFAQLWAQYFKYKNGFCFHCQEFEGTSGEWPVLFSTWRGEYDPTRMNLSVNADVYVGREKTGSKDFSVSDKPINKWMKRFRNTNVCPPLTSAMNIATKNIVLDKLPDDALGFVIWSGNDVMHSRSTCILSSAYANGAGWGITPQNFNQTMVAAAARAMITLNWLNDKDQFSVPNIELDGYDNFESDMIVWLLFSAVNQTSSMSVEYNGDVYSVANHFFWKKLKNSIPYVAKWIEDNTQKLSDDIMQLLELANMMLDNTKNVRPIADPKFQLDREDAGWFQLRRGILSQNDQLEWKEWMRQYRKKHLAVKKRLVPLIYHYGILPNSTAMD